MRQPANILPSSTGWRGDALLQDVYAPLVCPLPPACPPLPKCPSTSGIPARKELPISAMGYLLAGSTAIMVLLLFVLIALAAVGFPYKREGR